MEGRETHLGLWTTAHCDRAFQTQGLSEAELLPEHAAIFNLGGGGARDSTRDDNIVFFTRR